jgi:FixJ family two-component response regulator
MPRRSGADFHRALDEDASLRSTPVIVISGLPGRAMAVRNPVAVFDKPIDPAAFLEAVERALK